MTQTDTRTTWRLQCTVNGRVVDIEVPHDETLLTTLRDRLELTGAKGSCLEGECGSCTVIVDGLAMNSCLVLSPQMQGRTIQTIEGVADGKNLHVLQDKFLTSGAAQCGYCTPGLIMAAKAFLEENSEASEDAFVTALEGNICRCTGYAAIREAMRAAAKEWSA